MKFGTLLELNSNIDWWSHYVDYDGLKKLFPAEPFERPSQYGGTSSSGEAERSPLLPQEGGISQEDFIKALDKERQKVIEFYALKKGEIMAEFETLKSEIGAHEERELLGDGEDEDSIIAEEEEDGDGDGDGDYFRNEDNNGDRRRLSVEPTTPSRVVSGTGTGIGSGLPPNTGSVGPSPRLTGSNKKSFFKRVTSFRPTGYPSETKDDHDILIADTQRTRKRSISRDTSGGGGGGGPMESPTKGTGIKPGSSSLFPRGGGGGLSGHGRNSSESDDGMTLPSSNNTPARKMYNGLSRERSFSQQSTTAGGGGGRRPSASSASSFDPTTFRYRGNLGLIPMDVPPPKPEGQQHDEDDEVYYIWTANSDYGKVIRIGFKKKIAQLWLEAYALGQYVELNMTAFEKILKKYDKNTSSKLKKSYIAESIMTSKPWRPESKASMDLLIDSIMYLYARIAAGGDIELARQQLRAQLREKIVVDRETVWSKIVQERRREDSALKVVGADNPLSVYEKAHAGRNAIRTPCGSIPLPGWMTMKGFIIVVALVVLGAIVKVQPFEREEESNCLGILVFCTILWASEAIPLFVTSFCVPFLVVGLRVIKSADGEERRLSASEATKYIFSQMFSPTIMLLIGGFTIASVLSKTRLDVMTATRVLNAAGTNPSMVLLCLMFVATFASMWISNVAAPTLCYALIKPITDELAPKSVFSRCLIIAIALASNIGGQASPISSPQNLIALGAMQIPLTWLEWFAISIPVATVSIFVIWAFLHLGYRWEPELRIPKMRKNTDKLTGVHYYVLFFTMLTIGLWCAEKSLESWVGDMGIIAIIPLVAFFGAGILSKDDFHHFHWSIVFLAMGGIALGKAVLSSGLLDDLDAGLEAALEGLSLYSILLIFSAIALVIATFISHTIAAVLLVPIAQRIGDGLEDPHPRLLIMATALICSAGMGLPVSGFPNMTAITQENKLGLRFIEASDFLKNGIPASILALIIIVTLGFGISKALGL